MFLNNIYQTNNEGAKHKGLEMDYKMKRLRTSRLK